ncbi:hypothetical protein E2C01_006820 [Portunus trituberculatus]|uniref:Uncharacterized protein n=1 Tax=Portunus trituberculatus TaxID=210409 RepID=A0A5B7CW52_PORTR|nr:hypothetical protein [Portunus trituberculatus]
MNIKKLSRLLPSCPSRPAPALQHRDTPPAAVSAASPPLQTLSSHSHARPHVQYLDVEIVIRTPHRQCFLVLLVLLRSGRKTTGRHSKHSPVHAHLITGLMPLLSPSPPAPPPPAEQKQESWIKPLVDLTVKEGKEKIAKFEGEFSKKDSKPKWFFKKDRSPRFRCDVDTYSVWTEG